jgi:mono/diheme cytochrome c family protein
MQNAATTSSRRQAARFRPSNLAVACFGMVVAGASYLQLEAARPQEPRRPATIPGRAEAGEVLNKYCITCHNARLKTGGLALDSLDLSRVGERAEVWEKVATKLRTREMPPPGRPRPDAGTYVATTNAVEAALDAAAAADPNPGRVAVHRLNRAEYANAVRDLLGLEIDSRALLSAEHEAQEGFDNVASVLSASPALIENYLSAARIVSRLAIGDPTLNPVVKTFNISKLVVQDEQMSDDLPFGSQGGALIRYHFPLDGEYTIKVLLRRQLYAYIMGLGEPHQLDIRLDGVRLKRFTVGGEAKGMTMPLTFAGNTQGDPDFELYMHNADAGLEVRVPVKAGVHEIGVSFVRRFWEPESFVQPPPTGFFKVTNENYHGNPAVEFVMIGGPYNRQIPKDSPTRQRIFVCYPKRTTASEAARGKGTPQAERAAGGGTPAFKEEADCAQKILSALAARAFRRPVDADDLRMVMDFYRAGRSEENFAEGIRRGLEWILSAPSFLFRIEHEPRRSTPKSDVRRRGLSDLELASRLSFFLWSSIPDDELIGLASSGKLKEPVVLDQQVRRMLRDSRSKALVDNFATRWLELSKLSAVVLDTDLYSEFDENLREAMAEETKLFVADQLREDRSALELLSADYTFLNERLARHYGVSNIYGNHFRRVTMSDGRRGGLLGQASILTVTSYANRTSVVTRGKWVLANLLGAPPPPPPPDVPALKEAGMDGQPRSLRERMEMHRKNPACATCHMRMDPIGFSLENFDADGTWRTVSDGAPIDASASLPDGTQFEGVSGLRSLLVSHKEDFARTLTAKLLAYAIGRGIEYYDLPAVRKIARDAAAKDYRWSSIIAGIVKSPPFTMSGT